jgi:hypothetical protein
MNMNQAPKCILENQNQQQGNCVRCPYFDCMVLVDTTSIDGPTIIAQGASDFNICAKPQQDMLEMPAPDSRVEIA